MSSRKDIENMLMPGTHCETRVKRAEGGSMERKHGGRARRGSGGKLNLAEYADLMPRQPRGIYPGGSPNFDESSGQYRSRMPKLGGNVLAKKRGGKVRHHRGMGGSLISALAGLLPFAEGGEVERRSMGGDMMVKTADVRKRLADSIRPYTKTGDRLANFINPSKAYKKRGGSMRHEHHGFGGSLLGSLAGLLPFAEGGEVEHSEGGTMERRRGGRMRREHHGMGGSLLSTLAGLLPFAEGGEVERSEGGEMERRRGGRMRRAEGGTMDRAEGGEMGRRRGGRMRREDHGMGELIGKALPMLGKTLAGALAGHLANKAADRLFNGPQKPVKKAMGGVGKIRHDQYD